MFYGSNGMSAGNTREEALVQGMSEVVERYVQKRIFSDRPALPDIPEDYLRRFEDIYGMYCAIRESGQVPRTAQGRLPWRTLPCLPARAAGA